MSRSQRGSCRRWWPVQLNWSQELKTTICIQTIQGSTLDTQKYWGMHMSLYWSAQICNLIPSLTSQHNTIKVILWTYVFWMSPIEPNSAKKTVLADESSILSISNPGELFQTLSQLSQLWPSKLLPSVELSKRSSHWWWHTTVLSTSTQNS